MRHAHQRTGAVKQIDQEKYENHRNHAAVKQLVEIHLHKSRCHAGNGRHHAGKLGQSHTGGKRGDQQDADDDGAAHAEIIQNHNQEKTQQRQQYRPIGRFHSVFQHIHISHFHQSGITGDHQTRVLQGNQCQKQADTGGNRHFQTHRQSVNQHFPNTQKAENKENNTRNEYRCQRHLPRHTHTFDHGESKISIQAHARCQRNRIVGKRAHNETADGGRNASCYKHRAEIHAGERQNAGVDDDDIAHGQESGDTGKNFGAHGGTVFAQFKQAFEQALVGSSHVKYWLR